MNIFFVFVYGLCWGSFINVLAMRVLVGQSLWCPRSSCPICQKQIAWYDNIPLLSFFFLKARCRNCKEPISWLYPCIELATALCAVGLFLLVTDPLVYAANAIFFTALLAATRTDLATMLIPQHFSLMLVPIGLVCSWYDLLTINFTESILGSLLGYGILWGIAKIFFLVTKREGMGRGDMDLLAGIGAWIGPVGAWVSLMLASTIGLMLGCCYLLIAGKGRATRIPFGPFLALGAVAYVFYGQQLLQVLLLS
jgi:leader peptidase (prepilin peptidase)/N-methyltransferase